MWSAAFAVIVAGGLGCSSTTPVVPRMPMVATGVAIFMSPEWATLPATKAKVPSTKVNSAPLRIAVGVVRIVVERHARIGDQIERGAVGKRDAARRAGAGLDHVALEHGVADMERDGYAVAHHGDIADDFFDFADGVGRRSGLRLCIMSRRRRTGEQIDRVGRQVRTVRRHQCRVMLAREVAWN